jgi:hypothetical protein
MKRIGIFAVLGNALQVTFRNLGIVLLIAVVSGTLGWLLADFLAGIALDAIQTNTSQQRLIVSELSKTFALTVWGCVVGAWAAPATLYLWVQHEKGRPTSVYEAVNYGLNRFSRVLGPHARALFIIQLGLIVIVPGILFGLQYAFVDAIATLDTQEKDPIARSRKLTAGRRGTIFRTFLFFLVWWVPMQLGGLWWLQGQGTLALALGGAFDGLVLIVIDLCMVQFYLDLFRKPAAASEVPAATSA